MTSAPPPWVARPPASDPLLIVVGIITIAAPIVAVLAKLPSFGWLMLIVIVWGFLLWIPGYAVLVLAVARGMLRRRGVLRVGARRIRSIVWALLTSIGVVVLGLTLVDGGDTRESIQSTLTIMLGSPMSPSPAHALSESIGWVAAVAWLAGYVGLVVEWIVGAQRARGAAAPIPPPVAPPRVD